MKRYKHSLSEGIYLITWAEEERVSDRVWDAVDNVAAAIGAAKSEAGGDYYEDGMRDCLGSATVDAVRLLQNPEATGFDKIAFANRAIDQFEEMRNIDAIKHDGFAKVKIPEYIGRIIAARDAVTQPVVVSHPDPSLV